MRPTRTKCFAALAAAALSATAVAGPPAQDVRRATTPDGVEYGTWGGTPGQPSPTLIVLTGTLMDSFTRGSFLRAGNVLGPKGYLCVAIDLPNHGALATTDLRGVPGWARRAIANDDFVAEFNARMSKVVDHLIDRKLADPARIVVSGTSRGGFMAIHYLAFDPRVKAAVAYAPPTDLRKVDYFAIAKDAPMVDQLGLDRLVPTLVGKPLLIFIGDRDARVDTDTVIGFARKLSAAAVAADVPSQVELHLMSEPRGHALPPGIETPAAAWIERTLQKRPPATMPTTSDVPTDPEAGR